MTEFVAVPMDIVPFNERAQRQRWLVENFGKSSTKTWYFDIQPLIEDLIMSEEIATMYLLKWGTK